MTEAQLHGRGPTRHGSSAIWPGTTHTRPDTVAELYGLGGSMDRHAERTGASGVTLNRPFPAFARANPPKRSERAGSGCSSVTPRVRHTQRLRRTRTLRLVRGRRLWLPGARTALLQERSGIERLASIARLLPGVERSNLLIRQRPRNVLDRTRERGTQERTNALALLLPVCLSERLCCPIVRRDNLAHSTLPSSVRRDRPMNHTIVRALPLCDRPLGATFVGVRVQSDRRGEVRSVVHGTIVAHERTNARTLNANATNERSFADKSKGGEGGPPRISPRRDMCGQLA